MCFKCGAECCDAFTCFVKIREGATRVPMVKGAFDSVCFAFWLIMLYGTMVDNVSFEYSDESSGEGSIKNSENYGYA